MMTAQIQEKLGSKHNCTFGLCSAASWPLILQTAGVASLLLCNSLQRKHLQQGSKGRHSCSKEVGIKKRNEKQTWGLERVNKAGAINVGFLIQTIELESDSDIGKNIVQPTVGLFANSKALCWQRDLREGPDQEGE